MIVRAYMTAFHRGSGPVKVREIEVSHERIVRFTGGGRLEQILGVLRGLRLELRTNPIGIENGLLDAAYELGQNDFQPVADCPSVSVGDVIELPSGRSFRVASFGFTALGLGEDPTALVGCAAQDKARA